MLVVVFLALMSSVHTANEGFVVMLLAVVVGYLKIVRPVAGRVVVVVVAVRNVSYPDGVFNKRGRKCTNSFVHQTTRAFLPST